MAEKGRQRSEYDYQGRMTSIQAPNIGWLLPVYMYSLVVACSFQPRSRIVRVEAVAKTLLKTNHYRFSDSDR